MKMICTLLAAALCIHGTACTPDQEEAAPRPPVEQPGGGESGGNRPDKPDNPDTPDNPPPAAMRKIRITAGTDSFTATLADNAATAAFGAMLPMSVTMGELNGNEKYCYLSSDLPTAAFRPGTIRSGDLMLFGSNCLVIFYETFATSYSYTLIGRIDDPSGLAGALGAGSIHLTIEKTNE